MTREAAARQEAERQAARSRSASHSQSLSQSLREGRAGRLIGSSETNRTSVESDGRVKSPAERTLEKAQKQASKTERHGRRESDTPDRTLMAVRSPGGTTTHLDQSGNSNTGGGLSQIPTMTLPVVEERDNEAASTGGRSGKSGRSDRSVSAVTTSWQDKQLPDLPDGVPSLPPKSIMRNQGHDLNPTITQSPTDFRLEPLAGKGKEIANGNTKYRETGLLPGIPHLTPLTAEIPSDALDPEKVDANTTGYSGDGNGQQPPLTRRRSPHERWVTD